MSPPILRFEIGADAAVELDAGAIEPSADAAPADSPWTIATEPDWASVEALRLLAARFEDGSALALAALRPAGADGHDAERVAAAIVDPKGATEQIERALVSSELDAAGGVRRVGAELWRSEDPPPLRLAADRTAEASETDGDVKRQAVAMRARLDGVPGAATFEVLRPG